MLVPIAVLMVILFVAALATTPVPFFLGKPLSRIAFILCSPPGVVYGGLVFSQVFAQHQSTVPQGMEGVFNLCLMLGGATFGSAGALLVAKVRYQREP